MSVKVDRMEGIIQKEVTRILTQDVKDPKIGFITITDVKVTNDLSQAKIYVTFLGKEEITNAGLTALDRSKGYIRSELAKALTIRKVPELIFVEDDSLEQGNRIERILYDLQNENK